MNGILAPYYNWGRLSCRF